MWTSHLYKKNNMNCNRRATDLRKNTGGQHRDTFTYLKQQRMTCPSILSALQNKIHMIRHPCMLWYVSFAHLCQSHQLSSLLNKKQSKKKRKFPYASDKGVALPTFAATLHQVEILSELTKLPESGLTGREMVNFHQLPDFSSGWGCATLALRTKTMTACKAPELS